MKLIWKLVIGVVVLFLALWAFQWYKSGDSMSLFKRQAKEAATATEVAREEVVRVDTVYAPSLIRYRTVREANRDNAGAVAVAVACDSALTGDSIRLAARDTLIKRQTAELKVWMDKPGPPRIQPYVEAMYDMANAVPVGRVGVTARVAGPIALSAAGQYTAPRAGTADVRLQATVGLRYTF